jgi:peroxiredoxin Q/BCP
MAVEVGAQAPEFSLQSTEGGSLSLADLRGKKVVIFFYPKDDTPGCTVEACDFRDHQRALEKAGAAVIGVSKDGMDSHNRFKQKFKLTFPLLVDADSATAKAYGAFGPKTSYGKTSEGTIRSTFLIDETGKVQRAWSPVKVDGHVAAVMDAVLGREVEKK